MATFTIIMAFICAGWITVCVMYIVSLIINIEHALTNPQHAYLIEWKVRKDWEISPEPDINWSVVYLTPTELEDYIETFEYNRILSITKLD